ncbi:rRNA maturation RNase YbeY [Aequorivita sp. CIP111184]|uniref:rRNA maturation RNase YbeY n=1 Tax=Aequorivita sp. CIP111184 TaxID=2211356 RepID=UPI000DBBFF36|nr:rRNA maturation RNase YbeY [Aequorivita sp. CIP111184]SRX52602.1 Endoribonuclease YbeY [Aequorivita sp. CIP111184]
MIDFTFETDFKLKNEAILKQWISESIISEGYEMGEILYVFCDDEFLHKLNLEFLNHDTLTDIISFDYKVGNQINGEIYISVERVEDNAKDFNTNFDDELHRVMIHGILHFCEYKDKTKKDEFMMRVKEEEALKVLSKM